MSIEEMSDDERHYFESGGDVKEGLTKETPAPAPETPAPEPSVAATDHTEAPAPAPETADDAEDEPAETPTAEEPKRGRRVSRKEFESERTARLKTEQDLQNERVKAARVEERLNMLQQALQEPAPATPTPAQTRPDPEQDIFAYTRWLEEQLNSVTSKVSGYEEQITAGQQEMDNERKYFDSLNNYAGEKPDFVHAYNHLLRSRAAELTARSYSVTQEQLQGIIEGKVRVPQPIADALKQEERELYRNAFQSGADPAAQIYQFATMRGYRAPAAAPAPQAAPAGTPGTPLGGSPAAPAAPQAPAQRGAPTASDIVAQVQHGKGAAASLSNAGGGSPDTELTPQALAEMSEERFAEILNELQARGDKTKLMQLFGS